MKFSLFLLVGGMLMLASCSKDDMGSQDTATTEPGTYIVGMNLNLNNPLTKGVNGIGNGQYRFTSTYEAEYIYLHNQEGSIQIPVHEMSEECGEGCKGFSYQICVDNNGDATVYPINANGEVDESQSLNIPQNGKAYFSSFGEKVWEAEVSREKVPNDPTAELYTRDNAHDLAEEELFRSVNDLSIDDLQEGGQLDLTRVCSGFSFFCAFTDRNDKELTAEDFKNVMGDSYENYSIRIFLGSFFAKTYDIQNRACEEDEIGGYYASISTIQPDSNNPGYAILRDGVESSQNGSGFGYVTKGENYLLAPIHVDRIHAYIYIAHNKPDGTTDIIYTEATLPITYAEENNFYRVGTDINIQELANAFANYDQLTEAATSTRSASGPRLFTPKSLITTVEY